MVKPIPTYQKLRGGYYTPKPIGKFLARWAIRSRDDRVLDPSCGDGGLLSAAAEVLLRQGSHKAKVLDLIYGVELDPCEAQKAVTNAFVYGDLFSQIHIHTGDFFSYCKAQLANEEYFDVIIGNPPFIRYQNFPEEYRTVAFELMCVAGLKPNRLTNAWVPFVVASSLLLSKQGRLAMVIPAELLQVNYTAELRLFLSKFYDHIVLVTFRKLIFDGVQQEVVLLLAERSNSEHRGINVIELNDASDLKELPQTPILHSVTKQMDHSTEKWTTYFLDKGEIELLRALKTHPQLTVARDVIDVDVGIVTGLNEFFVLSEKQVADYSLEPFTQPIVGRSTHLQGAIFDGVDWQESVQKQAAAFLLRLPDVDFESLPIEIKNYVSYGEQKGMNKGYKCRIRKHWYIVPSVWIPDAFMLRQIHLYPKIIVNDASATCTDTIHRVKLRNGTSARVIASAFLNALTFAFSEVIGRSYGGGVLELEPNEAEKLPIPLMNAEKLDLDEIDGYLRKGDIETVLDITDRVLLEQGIGLTTLETQRLRAIWKKLRDRRINRK